MRVIVIPIGGLANRMRVIDSVSNLREEGCKVTVLWRKDWGLGARFDSIFEPCEFVKDVDKFPLIVNFAYKAYSKSKMTGGGYTAANQQVTTNTSSSYLFLRTTNE